jgi:hypothetical protein
VRENLVLLIHPGGLNLETPSGGQAARITAILQGDEVAQTGIFLSTAEFIDLPPVLVRI